MKRVLLLGQPFGIKKMIDQISYKSKALLCAWSVVKGKTGLYFDAFENLRFASSSWSYTSHQPLMNLMALTRKEGLSLWTLIPFWEHELCLIGFSFFIISFLLFIGKNTR